ncbi:Sulfurtransferase TusD [Vibrio stylophorae]|uniref:Sulfurtransferase TusD homolog n=1 Tax=Vibrio stylophorae TaxID=659351 RepID=A0ABN8DU12_9VIBR|nr:sulfurtransferase complex subunit TusD [Vibrio stylophorae]CAH0534541.1 Sulfurtransferase TusD [Vibrio stylophorae]
MSLSYALVVSGPAYGSQASHSALAFAQAVVARGHQLVRVFFYQDGVYNASSLNLPASDEFDVVAAWQALAQQTNCELITCVAAALRRGIVSEQEATQANLTEHNLADGFSQGGLGVLAESLLDCDRVIQF